MIALTAPLLILCHHPENKAGPLMTTLRTVLAGGKKISELNREDFVYQDLTEPGAFEKIKAWLNRHEQGILLFTGALSLSTTAALRTLRLTARTKQHKQIIFWHDTATIFRHLTGIEFESMWSRFNRRMRFRLVHRLLDNTRTYHLAVSKQCKQLVMFTLGVLPGRVMVCGEAVNVDSCPVRDRAAMGEEVRFCMAGDLVWRKGVDRFVGIAGRIQKALTRPTVFTWYGGEDKAYQAMKKSELGNRAEQRGIIFAGFQSPLVGQLSRQDVFLLTSRDDPFPIVALEALACDLPVFCYDTTGTSEVVGEEFVCHDGMEMTEKVRTYLANPHRYPAGFFRGIASRHGHDGQFLHAWNRLMKMME